MIMGKMGVEFSSTSVRVRAFATNVLDVQEK
jgi:hypothetical protein